MRKPSLFAALFLTTAAFSRTQATPTYEVYAIRFGVIPQFAVSGLVAGADPGRKLDIPAMVWLLKGPDGRRVLVDSGFYRKKFVDAWKVQNFRSPADAVAAAGIAAGEITDVIISHAHWDHVDGADLFPKATVWIQRDEYRYYTGDAWQSRNTHGGIDQEDMQALLNVNMAGRLRFVEGDDQEPIPGIRCYTGGKHTWASQYVAAPAAGGTIVLASDNTYLYENLEKRLPIAQRWMPRAICERRTACARSRHHRTRSSRDTILRCSNDTRESLRGSSGSVEARQSESSTTRAAFAGSVHDAGAL